MARTGRPRKDRDKTKSTQLTLRMPEALKAKITAAAEAKGRSASDECAARLEASFSESAKVYERDFGSAKTLALSLLIAKAISDVECWTGKEWDRDAFTFQQTKLAVAMLMEGPAVSGEPNPPDTFPDLDHLPDTAEGAAIRNEIAEEMLAIGVGPICARQVVDDLRLARDVLRIAPSSTAEEEPLGSDFRVALAAAREFRRRPDFRMNDLMGLAPKYFRGNWVLHYEPSPDSKDLADKPFSIAVYRHARAGADGPSSQTIGVRLTPAPESGEQTFRAKFDGVN